MEIATRIGPQTRRLSSRRLVVLMAVILSLTAANLLFATNVAAVAITVPYSATPVADADLDGDPATGAWGDALVATVPLENGDTTGYGTATLYTKHNGTRVYFRIDGRIDVAWISATGNHFWLGMQVSPATGGHHSGGTWDGVYFGLWNGVNYVPQPVYPPTPVDTNGFARPPAMDASQDLIGRMRYSGTAAPYSFTAEWTRRLNTGDIRDVAFTADGATTYYFYVTTDSDGGGSAGGVLDHTAVTNVNTMRFASVPPPNTPPVVDLTTPNGGEVWTGGSVHRVWWNMTDAQTATPSLRAWINYSTDGGLTYGPIPGAQGLTGLANPCSYSWTVPLANTLQARVRVTVADAQGATGSDASLANFVIDSTPPTVTAFNPADGATGVSPATPVRASFSEAMNRVSAEQAFSLRRPDTGAYTMGTFAWLGNDLTFSPSTALAQGVVYRAQVNATAKDASDPGNALGTVRMANFTIVDVTPPTISGARAVPSPQEAGLSVNVSAAVTDNGVVSGVWIEIRDPAGALVGNFTASYDPGTGRYFREAPYATPGTYTFTISARDAAGNWAVASGNFVVVDTRAPTIQHTPVIQALRGVPIRISATVTDAQGVANVRINYTDVLGGRFNLSLTLNGTVYEYDIPGQPSLGTLTYFLWAADLSGNVARTPAFAVAIVSSDATPPSIANVLASPPVQNASFSVNVTATVTDNVALRSVTVAIRDPSGALIGNFTMLRIGTTDTFYFARTYGVLGVHGLVVWAVDTSNNNASAGGSFEIVDRMAPVFQIVSVTPPIQEAGLPTNVTARVTDNVAVAGVRIRILDPVGGVALDASVAGGPNLFWTQGMFASLGTFSFLLNASDAAGNYATSPGSFRIVDTRPPVAVAGPDVLTGRGSYVTFNGSGSYDNSAIANYTWSFLDIVPVFLYGVTASYTFNNAGSFLVTLTVTDVASNPASDTLWVNVTADSTPPVARAGPDRTITIGQSATLDGSASTDDVGIVNYTWRVERTNDRLYGAVVSYRPNAGGLWTIILTVTDAAGLPGSDDVNVTVLAPDLTPPAAPRGVVASTYGPGAILVSWEPNTEPDLAGYVLYRSDFADGPFVRLNAEPLTNTTYADSGLVPGETYWYVVRAVDHSGNLSLPSTRAEGMAGLAPADPFDPRSIRWAVVPALAAGVLGFLAVLAWREGRRRKRPEPPTEGAGS